MTKNLVSSYSLPFFTPSDQMAKVLTKAMSNIDWIVQNNYGRMTKAE